MQRSEEIRNRTIAGGVVIGVSLCLKAYYSRADSEELAWFLQGIAAVVELLSGLSFIRESGVGWINYDHHVVIVPACAGLNFMVIAFCMASFLGIRRFNSFNPLCCWLVTAGVTALVLTLAVNSLRIYLSILLYQADIYGQWVTPALIHRLAGVSIYYGALLLYYCGVDSFLRHRFACPAAGRLSGMAVPLCSYLLVVLVIPLAHKGFMKQDLSMLSSHALMVVPLVIALSLLGSGCICGIKRLKK